MIQIIDKKECCGCNACSDICPKNAISFKIDIDGFWYPEVNNNICINCELCVSVCPIINISQLKKNDLNESECYAAIHKNIEIRFDSTSGGLFSALAEEIYKANGYVGGAIFNPDYSVKHFISNNRNDLVALRSSKYLQSNAEGFYKSVLGLLKKGERVLVCGTPCQMAALRRYIKKDYDNLIIVDFICLGVNSPKVFRKYLDFLEKKYNSKIVYFKAKNKELGWRKLTSKVVFENGNILYDTRETSYFTTGFICTHAYCRPSCYDCKFKGFPRIADITVADLWGAEKIADKDLDNDLGTSLVMINSVKGREFFSKIQTNIIYKKIPFKSILPGNHALIDSIPSPNLDRNKFYHDLDKYPFETFAAKYIRRSIDKPFTIRKQCKNIVLFIYRILKASNYNIFTLYKNIKYNFFCKNIKTSIRNGGYIILYKNTLLVVKPKALINLQGCFLVGTKKFSKSNLETRLLVENNGKLIIKNHFSLGYGSDVEVFNNATLEIDGNSMTNSSATIICGNYIKLGERTILGRNITIRDNNGDHFIAMRGYKVSRPIIIGQHVWLCEGATVMPGVKIGDGAIIGAKSLVLNNVPSFSLVTGNPAKIVEDGILWKY